jgi:20S proteasome subunit alpha 5
MLCSEYVPTPELQDKYRNDLTLLEAENLALEILKQVMEDKVSHLNVELATVTAAGYHTFDYDELDVVINRLA